MMSALNNPWKPQNRITATSTWSAVPPLVYLSATGTPVSDTQSKKETGEKYVPMNFSAVDKTVLTPQGRQEMKGVASPIKFTEALQNGDALKVNPQGGALMEALGFGLEEWKKMIQIFTCLMGKEGNLVRLIRCSLMNKHWKETQVL